MDPSLSNWAFAAARMHAVSQELDMRKITLARTKKSSGKGLVCHDDLARGQILSDKLFSYAPHANVIFVEVPTGSQSARAAAGYGVCIGILAALRSNGIPFIEITPHALKMASVGKTNASKEAVIEWAMNKYPDAGWPMHTSKGKTTYVKDTANHMADAIAAIHAGVQTNHFQQLMALRR